MNATEYVTAFAGYFVGVGAETTAQRISNGLWSVAQKTGAAAQTVLEYVATDDPPTKRELEMKDQIIAKKREEASRILAEVKAIETGRKPIWEVISENRKYV